MCYVKCNQSRPRFELVSPCPFPITINITPRAPPCLINQNNPKIFQNVFMLGGSLTGRAWGCESLVMHARRAFSGSQFSSSFSVWDVKRGRREKQRGRISWYPWDTIATKLKTQTFLSCTGLNVSIHLPFIFFLFGHSSLLGGDCVFVIFACEGSTQVSRSEERTKVTCCVVA